jgi:hypothetical protein
MDGYDQEGYSKEGFDRTGRDKYGYDRQGRNADGFDKAGLDHAGRDRHGYSREGFDEDGYNRRGFNIDGRDRDGYDWSGFDKAGFDRTGFNRHGYSREGLDKDGYDRLGYDRKGYDQRGYGRQGFNAGGVDRFGYDQQGMLVGFDKEGFSSGGFDADGYDRDGYSSDGYDRAGYDRHGSDRSGKLHPWWVPDAAGYYGDNFDQYGYDREGYNVDGRDRWGFNREGLNESGRDRDGYSSEGYNSSFLDRERYNKAGYNSEGYDRLGYSTRGHSRFGFSVTGYDKDGYDKNGINRWGRDRNNRDQKTGRQYRTLPYNKSGFDKDGYDRWGFNRDTGLTSDGRNYAGWIYDPKTKSCYDPSEHSRSMPHNYFQDGHGVQWKRPSWQTKLEWDPSVAPKWDPRAPMTWQEYASVYGAHDPARRAYESRLHPQPNVEQRWQQGSGQAKGDDISSARANADPHACAGGVPARCPQCGQFTSYRAHSCPAFGNRQVTVFRSGLARREGQSEYLRPGDEYNDKGLHVDTRQTMDGCYPVPTSFGPSANGYSDTNPRRAEGLPGLDERDPAYANGGYDRLGFDQDGRDRSGRDRRGRDAEGYDLAGYDWLGRDRNGYDRHGHDPGGSNRSGAKRPRSLQDLAGDYQTPGMEGDVLANEGVRRLYSQVATSLAGESRQVVFREGEGFATDMQGTIYLDPYPLGRNASPLYNAAVVMEGLQHEMGHELETPYDTFKRILEIAGSPEPVEGLDGGRRLVKTIYNIVEDGRMERCISRLPGVAEYLAVGCKLQPRWDEKVGEGVPISHELQGALLYDALPFFQLRPEVLGAMTPEGRTLFDELRPILHSGVFGEPEDAYDASVEIARRLQDAGISVPDEQISVSAPAFFSAGSDESDGQSSQTRPAGAFTRLGPASGSGSGTADGSGQGEQGQSDMGGDGKSTSGNTEFAGTEKQSRTGEGGRGPLPADGVDETAGSYDTARSPHESQSTEARQRGGGGQASQQSSGALRGDGESSTAPAGAGNSKENSQRSASSRDPQEGSAANRASTAGSSPSELQTPGAPFSDEQVRRTLESLERDLSEAIESDIRRQSRVEALGRNLHKPIGTRQHGDQAYRDAQGHVRSVAVQFPAAPSGDAAFARLQKRRSAHRQVARQLARYLENVRDVADETANFQRSGRLDRHRFAAALKDAPDVYRRRIEVDGAGFALSMAVDLSGSMSKEMRSGALCDAALVLSDACDAMSMPYEVRGFSGRTYQYKAMDEPAFSPDRAAMLMNGEGGGTNMSQTAALAATSLLARPERNKLFVSLTDGDLGDHDSAMRQMEQARRDGVLTFGIYLSRGGYVNKERMDQIYGKANWTVINAIQDMPQAVGRRIALLMRRAR